MCFYWPLYFILEIILVYVFEGFSREMADPSSFFRESEAYLSINYVIANFAIPRTSEIIHTIINLMQNSSHCLAL